MILKDRYRIQNINDTHTIQINERDDKIGK